MIYNSADNFYGSDTLAITIDDQGNTGAPNNLTADFDVAITVTPVNDAPEITAPALASVAEDQNFNFSTISINDIDLASGTAVMTLKVEHGVLTLGSTSGLTSVTDDGTGSITIEGDIASLNAALNGLVYNSNDNFYGSDTLAITIDDQGNTGAPNNLTADFDVAITVTPVNDAPEITAPALASVAEDQNFNFGSTISINDIDLASGTAVMTLKVEHGVLTLGSTSGLTSVTDDGTGSITIEGDIASLNAALNGLIYNSADNFYGSDILAITIDDQGNTGAPNNLTADFDVAITVTPVNDAPEITAPALASVAEDQNFIFGSTISINDIDLASGTAVMTLKVKHGVLTLGSTSGLTSVTDDGTGSITIEGDIASLNAAFNGLIYNSNDNFYGSDTLAITIDDQGNTGAPNNLTD